MDAAAGHLHHFAHRVFVLGVDDVGGAELPGQLQLARHRIDGDHSGGAGNGGTVDGGKADAPAADHGDGAARLHPCGVNDCAHARRDPAADERGAIKGHVLSDLRDGMLVHQHVLGK